MKINIQFKDLDTSQQYDFFIKECEDVFLKKTRDYGTAWRVLREISIVDQIYIKAQRIRTIQEKGEQRVGKIGDDIRSEFVGIINYSIIGLMQMELTENDPEELNVSETEVLYHKYFITAKTLMQSKNHDYGEAWRNMSQESFVDLVLMKLQRMRQILSNKGETIMSEGLDANFYDIINYAVFALILIDESKHL
jgi:Nucleotide modification associated domain 1